MAEQTEEAASLKFVIDEVEYDVPMLSSLSIGESLVFYGYAEISPLDVDEMTPPVVAALMHIALKRARTTMKDKAIRELLGDVNFMDLVVALAEKINEKQDEDEEKERPPTSPTPPGDESATGDVGSKSDSQLSSEPGSNGSSDHSPDLSDLSPTGAPV